MLVVQNVFGFWLWGIDRIAKAAEKAVQSAVGGWDGWAVEDVCLFRVDIEW